ncbi:MAG: YihY/virulence factor BrkB family protein [Steroidobacteraceae bacterium]
MLALLNRLEDKLAQKSRDSNRPWRPVLEALRYLNALIRDWLAGDIDTLAMSLAYTTLLSLVPLMVFLLSILKVFGARSDLRLILHEFFRPLGNADILLTETVMQFVTNMRGGVLGWIGLAMLLYTTISMIRKVEASFNLVWRIARPRGLWRRIAEFLGVMIAGPILLGVALEILASAVHSSVAQWLGSFAHIAWIFRLLGRLLPYAIVTIVFTFMYAFIPNTRVEFRPALIGGVTAGVVWALVGYAFSAIIVYSSHMVAVYTGFAIVLSALIWIYVSWLILLIGAQLACYAQFPQYLRHGREPIEPR